WWPSPVKRSVILGSRLAWTSCWRTINVLAEQHDLAAGRAIDNVARPGFHGPVARLPAATDRASVAEHARPFYDQIVDSRPVLRGPIAHVLPYAPEAAARIAFLGNTLRQSSISTPAQTELAICVAARARNQPYVWAAHSPTARTNGISESVMAVVDSRGPLDAVASDEALIVQFGRELLEEHSLSDATFERVRG